MQAMRGREQLPELSHQEHAKLMRYYKDAMRIALLSLARTSSTSCSQRLRVVACATECSA